MNWITRLSLTFLIFCTLLTAQAQEQSNATKADTYHGLYLGGSLSTNGWGGNISYTFNDWFSLKTGYETLSVSPGFSFSESDITYDATLDYKTGGVLCLADFAYARNFYISAGVIFNSYQPKISGIAVSDLEYGDITIPAEDIGSFSMAVESKLKASPYIGAGIQSYYHGVMFKFETGLYYMGSPDLTIEADGLLSPTADPAFAQDKYLEYQFDAYKIYPVIKLILAFKIF